MIGFSPQILLNKPCLGRVTHGKHRGTPRLLAANGSIQASPTGVLPLELLLTPWIALPALRFFEVGILWLVLLHFTGQRLEAHPAPGRCLSR